MDKEKKSIADFSSIDLTSKQSVRTTFRLKEKTYENMSLLAKTYKITQKELLNQMVRGFIWSMSNVSDKSFVNKALEIVRDKTGKKEVKFVRKTHVIPRESLKLLNKSSKEFSISRDDLIEISVAFLIAQLEDRKEKHQKALKHISNLIDYAEGIHSKLQGILDDEDPILNRVRILTVIIENLYSAIEAELSTGVPVDSEDFSQSC